MRNLFSQFLSSKSIKSCPPSTYEDITSNSVKLLCIFTKLTWTTVDRVSSIAMYLLLSKIYQTDFGEAASHNWTWGAEAIMTIKQNMGRNTTGFPAYHPNISKIIVKASTLKPVHMWITLGRSYFTLSETILLHLGAYLGSQAFYFVVVIWLTLLCSHL